MRGCGEYIKKQNAARFAAYLAKRCNLRMLYPTANRGTGMSQMSSATTTDPVSNVLKWILLAVAVVTFALLGWATFLTYERAPPQPERFVGGSGAPLMTADDILVGKAGFQKADLMDFGSLLRSGLHGLDR